MRITVIGTGYLGAVHAARMADIGFLRHVDEINMRRRRRAVDVARELLGGTFLGWHAWRAAGWTVRALGRAQR